MQTMHEFNSRRGSGIQGPVPALHESVPGRPRLLLLLLFPLLQGDLVLTALGSDPTYYLALCVHKLYYPPRW